MMEEPEVFGNQDGSIASPQMERVTTTPQNDVATTTDMEPFVANHDSMVSAHKESEATSAKEESNPSTNREPDIDSAQNEGSASPQMVQEAVRAQEGSIASPDMEPNPPSRPITTQDENIASPDMDPNPPSPPITTQDENIASPDMEPNPPSPPITTQDENIASPDMEPNPPSPPITTQDENIASPDMEPNPPSPPITTQDENIASPDMEPNPPSPPITTQDENIASPDMELEPDVISPQNQSFTSPDMEPVPVSTEHDGMVSPHTELDVASAQNEIITSTNMEMDVETAQNGSIGSPDIETDDKSSQDHPSITAGLEDSPNVVDNDVPSSVVEPEVMGVKIQDNSDSMATADKEEDPVAGNTNSEEAEIRKLKAQLAAVDAMDEEEEDLEDGEIEDGEIEDDDEVPPPVTEKPKPVVSAPGDTEKKKSSSSSSKHRHHSSSSKEKDVKKSSREKDSKSEKRRKHSTESKDDAEKSPRNDKDKSSKKRTRRSEDVSAGDDDYLFVRGASDSPPPVGSAPGGVAGRKIYDTDPFGNPIYEDELESTFPLSPEAKRRKKSRSPLNVDRRRRDETRGNRRPNSGRKDAAKPLHKSEQICAYYMQGKCQKSHEDCAFSHNAVPPRKMELCKFWMMDCCAKKEKCLYLHNDFPCKYYHTGLVCKQGLKNQCKFSHKPMNEVTKAVLLKHIETAPKEILGDFPRLNRQGALNLIAKMENRINGELKKQERERDEERRRTRWEQPTKDDENKLHELMEEAGLGNYYQETVEGASQPQNENHNHPRDRDHRKPQGMGITPLMGLLPNQLPPVLPNQPHIVHNPTLANVLASLQIPSTTIQRPSAQDEKENHKNEKNSRDDEPFRQRETRISPTSPPHPTGGGQAESNNEDENTLPDNLPPMQRGIFRRIQEQQLKNEKKIKEEPSDDEVKGDDRGWYSSDDESDKPLTDVLKEIPGKTDGESKPVVDFASVLSAIRKTTAASNETTEPDAKRIKISTPSPQLSAFTSRGDVDFRIGSGGVNTRVNDQPSTSQGPFRDTDFRVPPVLRQEFKDVDLRMSDSPPRRKSPPPPVFKSLPTGPATMIDAAINSHPPMTWKVRVAAGVKSPDYNYIKHTLTPAQLALDPRFGPRTAGGISILPDPASPPQQSIGANTPANIPAGDALLDPRMGRRMGQGGGPGLMTSDPRLGGDQRPGPGAQGQIPTNLMPPGWPPSVDMTQAALAAQLMAAQQLGLLPFPNPGGVPMMPPNFGDMSARPPFPHGRGSGPPASSWERYSQQQSPPL